VVIWAQQLGHLGIGNPAADLAADIFGNQFGRGGIERGVGMRSDETDQAANLPAAIEVRLKFARCHGQRGFGRGRQDPRRADRLVAGLFAQCRIGRLDRLLFRFGQRMVLGRDREIGRTLENGELRRLACQQRDRLDRARSRTDHRDPLAGEIDAFVRPLPSQIDRSGKIIETGNLGAVERGQAAGCHDAIARADGIAPVGFDRPALALFIPPRRRHPGSENNVAAQVEALGNVAQVGEDFGLRGIALAPHPFLLQGFVERIGIVVALDIAARAGITVPVPGAADVLARFDDLRAEAQLAQPVEHVEPGEARSHHDRVNLPLVHAVLLRVLPAVMRRCAGRVESKAG
jgi:hypothetical protein